MHHSVAGSSSALAWEWTGPKALVLLTLHSQGKVPWLATHEVHHLLRCVWRVVVDWRVGYYLLMPDHLHLFCAPAAEPASLASWLARWQRLFADCHRQPDWGFAEAIRADRLRDEFDYGERWTRVWENPVRRGLVARADEWVYQGSLRLV